MMLVGEQPGDQEDLAGRPFVGPAGRLLDGALADAGIDRDEVYLTNAVKHFKWKARGKRRIHDKPSWGEVGACRPWLDGELEAVRPEVLVLLGATAAQALLGRSFRSPRAAACRSRTPASRRTCWRRCTPRRSSASGTTSFATRRASSSSPISVRRPRCCRRRARAARARLALWTKSHRIVREL
jgi:uracil-DNA glycosylase family 4